MSFLKSIKSKIMVFAVLATLIPSLGLGLLSFRQNEAQTGENVTRQLRALTSYANREIELWMDKRVHEARDLAPQAHTHNSTAIVKMNSCIMRGASNFGQSGNSWKARLKYSGRISVACKVSAKPTASSSSHSGEDR